METASQQEPDPPPEQFSKKKRISRGKRRKKRKATPSFEQNFLLGKRIPGMEKQADLHIAQPEEESKDTDSHYVREEVESYSRPDEYIDLKKGPPQLFPFLTDRKLIEQKYAKEKPQKRNNGDF